MQPIRYPPDLPVSMRREEILAALRGHQVVIVAGETGSGKTTQLPKMCLEAGFDRQGKIGCTQPRRVAAMSVSRRVAEELGVTWGREVGCKIRFSDDTSRETRVKFMTDGILLAEIQSDPLLRSYSALIIDEAHERSLNIDFLLGYLQGLLRRRPELKVVITSATIDTQEFSRAFGGAPIVEVSGRLFPVAIRYAPADDLDEGGYIEAAARAAEDALIESDSGDVLVFMPTERDIRETRDLIEGNLGGGIEVLGLFGRMANAEQQRIFAPGPKRRVIIATNIAETSLTIPRIAYVIDSGLARVSRYQPRTRTKRLPIEEISQSSANQRAGRAGRVRDGVCIRLYPEDDFAERPQFAQPEIQRANLAEVILRMKAFQLGDIETFPFLNPPSPQAIQAGYLLLHELGALNDENHLTGLGHELARLPIDPTLGRMLLHAREEGTLPEMLIIAAGLSLPDPRERPEEEREAAAAAHRAFADPRSDFLSLLKIWRAAPATEGPSRNALRRFCKTNYLSMSRMREWREIYRQLAETLSEEKRGGGRATPPEAPYEAIHRSILTGLLGQIAMRQDRNLYKAAGNREVTLFPGSNLYERREKTKREAPPKPGEKPRQSLWIMSGEIVQTSQLFARTVAGIDPQWIIDLGSHLIDRRYLEPQWCVKAQRVLVWERALIHGLEVTRLRVDYGRVNPVEATELFIRGALVSPEGPLPHRFFKENQHLREKIETALTRVRSGRVHDIDEALYRFYAVRIQNVSSVHDLNQLVRSRIDAEPDFLCASEADLVGAAEIEYDRQAFPDQVSLGNSVLPLTYAYAPGQEEDGVTVRVPLPVAEQLSTGQLQWMVPGLREEQIAVLLRALPKSLRRPLMPLEPKVREIAGEFEPGRGDFLTALAAHLGRKYGVSVRAEDWPPESLPAHLQPRIEIVDRDRRTVAAGRKLDAVRDTVDKSDLRSAGWDRAALKWERGAVINWTFGDLPESIHVEQVGGSPLLAYPGLALRDGEVDVRLFRKAAEAVAASGPGVAKLAETALARDLAWLQKELKSLVRTWLPGVAKPSLGFGNALDQLSRLQQPGPAALAPDTLLDAAYRHIVSALCRLEPVMPLTEARFRALLDSARKELPLFTRRVSDLTKHIIDLRHKILATAKKYAGLEADLRRLASEDFLAHTPPNQLQHLPRYLRAVQIRAERAAINPAKDAEKARQMIPFAEWQRRVPAERRETYRWMLEEFRVSLFAQELGTAQPVSVQRLRALEETAG